MLLSGSYISGLVRKIVSDIYRVQYKASGAWHNTDSLIKSAGENHLTVDAIFPIDGMVIRGIRVIDSQGNVIAERAENITKPFGDRLVIHFKITISERSIS